MFAFAQHTPNLRIQYHAGLEGLLRKEASRIVERPAGSSTVAGSLAHGYQRELNDMYEALMEGHKAVRQIDLDAARARKEQDTEFNLEEAVCRVAYNHLADPINSFCEEVDNFKDMPFSHGWTGWLPNDCDGGRDLTVTEWVGRHRGTPRAICHWKLDVTEADMESIRTAGTGVAPSAGNHALHPGFHISRVDKHGFACTDTRVTENAARACALVSSETWEPANSQAWSDMHLSHCRWHMICNGRTAIVMYLARPDVLFVSDVIRHDAGEHGEALTIAVALLALLILPKDDRPTCTFNNDALKFRQNAANVAAARQREATRLRSPSPPSTPAPRSPSSLLGPGLSDEIGPKPPF